MKNLTLTLALSATLLAGCDMNDINPVSNAVYIGLPSAEHNYLISYDTEANCEELRQYTKFMMRSAQLSETSEYFPRVAVHDCLMLSDDEKPFADILATLGDGWHWHNVGAPILD